MCFFFNPFSTLLSSDRQILSFYIKVTMKGVDSLPFCELFSGSSVMPFFFILRGKIGYNERSGAFDLSTQLCDHGKLFNLSEP